MKPSDPDELDGAVEIKFGVIFSDYVVNDNVVNTFNYLGLTIDKRLSWNEHIKQICMRVNRFVFVLRRLRQIVF